MARKGLKLVLISRSLEKLKRVADEIGKVILAKVYISLVLTRFLCGILTGSEFGVEVRVIDVDFTGGVEIYDKIRKQTEGLNVGVLVNNVGISYNHPEYFVDCCTEDPQFLRSIVSANIHSVTHMTALFLPAMVKRGKGVIINLSSTAGVIPSPLLSVYSATKVSGTKESN